MNDPVSQMFMGRVESRPRPRVWNRRHETREMLAMLAETSGWDSLTTGPEGDGMSIMETVPPGEGSDSPPARIIRTKAAEALKMWEEEAGAGVNLVDLSKGKVGPIYIDALRYAQTVMLAPGAVSAHGARMSMALDPVSRQAVWVAFTIPTAASGTQYVLKYTYAIEQWTGELWVNGEIVAMSTSQLEQK